MIRYLVQKCHRLDQEQHWVVVGIPFQMNYHDISNPVASKLVQQEQLELPLSHLQSVNTNTSDKTPKQVIGTMVLYST